MKNVKFLMYMALSFSFMLALLGAVIITAVTNKNKGTSREVILGDPGETNQYDSIRFSTEPFTNPNPDDQEAAAHRNKENNK